MFFYVLFCMSTMLLYVLFTHVYELFYGHCYQVRIRVILHFYVKFRVYLRTFALFFYVIFEHTYGVIIRAFWTYLRIPLRFIYVLLHCSSTYFLAHKRTKIVYLRTLETFVYVIYNKFVYVNFVHIYECCSTCFTMFFYVLCVALLRVLGTYLRCVQPTNLDHSKSPFRWTI